PSARPHVKPLPLNTTSPTPSHTPSLHDALPIYANYVSSDPVPDAILPYNSTPTSVSVTLSEAIEANSATIDVTNGTGARFDLPRSEEHTSELQSRSDLVCPLLLEKKNEHVELV